MRRIDPELQVIGERMASQVSKKKGDIDQAQRKQWLGVLHAVDVMQHAVENDVRLKAIMCLSQAIAVYAKLLDTGVAEQRLEELEAWKHELTKPRQIGIARKIS